MLALLIGLLLFLGVHSTRLFAPEWRLKRIAKRGLLPYKGVYALISLLGLLLIIWGYAQARLDPTWLWMAPVWTRHLAALLTVPAFILLAATYIPGTHIKASVGHPMLLAVKFWAIAHLFANGTLADLLLFGSFLAWAIALYAVSRRRDRLAGVTYPTGRVAMDAAAVGAGLLGWLIFAMWLHSVLIGVKPFG
jgi:uncharacterized membrane protein